MNRIRDLRQQNSLTQSELGKILNCNQTAIGKYERGDLDVNSLILIKLSKFFNVSVDYLLGLEDDFGIKQPPNATTLSPEDLKLLKDFHSLDIYTQRSVRIQIEALAEKEKIGENK